MNNRWAWWLRGLPSVGRAHALFRARRHTMTSAERCRSLWDLCQGVIRRGVPGCFVECGVWRGGSAIVMGRALQRSKEARLLHLFDSFQGLPEPEEKDGHEAVVYSEGKRGGKLVPVAKCDASLDLVKDILFNQAGLDAARVRFHVGWFQDTVPAAGPTLGPIGVLRLDGDWYASTWVCLEHLYPLLSPGGVLILDDYYFWEGSQKATDEYRAQQGIKTPVVRVDATCGYWIKEA